MVNCDGPTEQNCCLKCVYVSFAESFLQWQSTSGLKMFSLFFCFTSVHHNKNRTAMHEKVAYETAERNCIYLILYFHTYHISVLILP